MNWLDVLLPEIVPCDQKAVKIFEDRLKRRLPEEYRDFVITFNGGNIIADHILEVRINGERTECAVGRIFPLNDSGAIGAQERWLMNDTGSALALPIANDGGTGFYFLMLDDKHWGNIYFAYKDEFFSTPSYEWDIKSNKMPECMAFVAKNFGKFGELIEAGKGRESIAD